MIQDAGSVIGPLVFVPQSDDLDSVRLKTPPASENIFDRIIRNPYTHSNQPRERACTEMLCAVLLNAPRLCSKILNWLATLGGYGSELPLDDLEFIIDTEQPIGSKRDDLRIEGWKHDGGDEEATLEFVWTIEIKVGASFHTSPVQHLNTDNDDGDLETVNQLINYDKWLSQLSARHVAGFVLAPTDLSHQLPVELKATWCCLSWTQLGRQIEQSLLQDDLPPAEHLLATHLH